MAIDFPNSPSTNDIFTSGGRSWTWTGTTWQAYVQALSNSSITNDLIADTTITAAKIANATITSTQIANTTITATQIANATITYDKLALSNSVVNADISSSAAIAATKISGTAIVQSIVDAKGDLIVATAADTVARQAVGSNGQVLVADSGVTNGVAWVDPQTNRNVIINGAMQVTQRGTSVASIAGNSYNTADRWNTAITNMGVWTQSVENDAPTGSGFRKSLKMLCTTADASPAISDEVSVTQIIEGQNLQQFLKGTSSAKQFTLSFWVKANVTGTYVVWLYDPDNTRHTSLSYTISASATWEKKTIIFTADTTGAFENDNGSSLFVRFYLGAGSDYTSGTLASTWASLTNANRCPGQTNLASATSNYWQITGVQLEAGSVATPFEFEDFGVTLAKCQRYYQRTTGTRNFGITTAQIATDAYGYIPLPCSMRVPPTSVESNTLRAFDIINAATTISALTLDGSASSESSAAIKIVTTGMTALRTYFIIQNGATSYLAFSAEL